MNFNLQTLPERYANEKQQLVRAHSIQGILKYVNLLRGKNYADSLVKTLKVPENYFKNSASFVNPLFGDDLLDELQKDHFNDYQMREMGTMTLITNFHTPLGKIFRNMDSPLQIYRDVHEVYVDRFGNMVNYKILRLSETGCTIEIRPSEEISEAFKTKFVGSRRMCLVLQGIYISLLGSIQKRFAKLVEKECMYQGSSQCIYEISWD